MWYNRLRESLLIAGYKNDPVCPCIFIRKYVSKFVIVVIYIDNINLIRTLEELQEAINYLRKEFKDVGKTKFVLAYKLNI